MEQQKKKTYLFIIQGEGRGHMMQAIALKQMLEDAGHNVVATLVGNVPGRNIPEFFYRIMDVPIQTFETPHLLKDKEEGAIKPWKSTLKSLANVDTYRKSAGFIAEQIEKYSPDIIINFYEPVCGIYAFLHKPKIPIISIANQYIYDHPAYEFPEEMPTVHKLSLLAYGALTSFGSTKRIALSLTKHDAIVEKDLIVVPPIIRRDVLAATPKRDPYILTYILNKELANEVKEWSNNHKGQDIHCFWDNSEQEETYKYNNNLIFHQLDDKKFFRHLIDASSIVTTAGFNAISEAAYLGKPMLVIPVAHHFEQYCNAKEVERLQLGITRETFDLEATTNIEVDKKTTTAFRNWVDTANTHILQELEHTK